MRAAVRPAGEAYWSRSVSHNVHLICLFYAASKGVADLRKGTQCVFNMHRLWAGIPKDEGGGGRGRLHGTFVESWSHFTALVLLRMLAADSAETISAALNGLHALVDVTPSVLPLLFEQCEGRPRSWLLHGSEVWAARQPEVARPILEKMWLHKCDLDLQQRIQLWICMLALSRATDGVEFGESFMPTQSNSLVEPSPIVSRPQRLLMMKPKMQGSTRLSNAYSAAENWLSRLQIITCRDTSWLESKIAEALNREIGVADEREIRKGKKYLGSEDGDMIITGRIDGVLNDALTHELCKPGWAEDDAADIAVAVAYGDDPWVVRHSPHPSPTPLEWPQEKEVDEWLKSGTASRGMLNRLRLMAMEADLKDGKRVLGSYLRLFTSHYDFEMWHWLESVPPEDGSARRVPLCPSGRCFQFFLPDRFEPRLEDRMPLVFFSGSFLFLSFGTLEVIPARFCQKNLNWEPVPTDPLKWQKAGRVVAEYERYHGPLDYNWSRRHMRQPTLSRWVCDKEELSSLKTLTPQWDHETHSFSED